LIGQRWVVSATATLALATLVMLGAGQALWERSPVLGIPAFGVATLAGVLTLTLLGNWLSQRSLLADAAALWPGKRGVLITSSSPRWAEHIRTHWLPRLGEQFVVLDYSRRSEWGEALEARLWRAFCQGQPDYVPAVILLRGLRPPLIFGFYRWFDAAQREMPEGLQMLEAELFAQLEAPVPEAKRFRWFL